MPSDIEIAQAAKMQRISKVALEKLGIAEEHLEPFVAGMRRGRLPAPQLVGQELFDMLATDRLNTRRAE